MKYERNVVQQWGEQMREDVYCSMQEIDFGLRYRDRRERKGKERCAKIQEILFYSIGKDEGRCEGMQDNLCSGRGEEQRCVSMQEIL